MRLSGCPYYCKCFAHFVYLVELVVAYPLYQHFSFANTSWYFSSHLGSHFQFTNTSRRFSSHLCSHFRFANTSRHFSSHLGSHFSFTNTSSRFSSCLYSYLLFAGTNSSLLIPVELVRVCGKTLPLLLHLYTCQHIFC